MSLPSAQDGIIPSFFMPLPGAGSSVSTNVDEDGSPTKRRRTSSSKVKHSKSRRVSTGDDGAPFDGNTAQGSPDDERHQPAHSKTSPERSKKMIKVRVDGKLASPKVQRPRSDIVFDGQQNFTPRQDIVPTAPLKASAPEDQMSPKKLMRVRSDGRLASPKSQPTTDGVQKKRRGRPRKAAEAAGRCLAIIRYGKTDEARLLTGQKIHEILSHPQTVQNFGNQSRPAVKPPEPPKTTHPFFSGKPLQKPQPSKDGPKNSTKIDEDGIVNRHQSGTTSSKAKSPRKATSNINGSSWADVGAPAHASILFGGSRFRAFPGANEPIWPPLGMVHVRPIAGSNPPSSTCRQLTTAPEPAITAKLNFKFKQAEVTITENQDVLRRCRSLVKSCTATDDPVDSDHLPREQIRIPQRRVLSGPDLQRLYSQRNSFNLHHHVAPETGLREGLGNESHQSDNIHPALSLLFNRIATSRTAFDRFECETHDWIHKYAPMKAEEILQPTNEIAILRDWLQSLAVNSVVCGEGKPVDGPRTSKKPSAGPKRKKRKRAEELDGFVISSDEEANEMEELADGTPVDSLQAQDASNRRTLIKTNDAAKLAGSADDSEKVTNVVILSGPNGCGKTAAAYAVAQELGFEVFEINAGSRRSGKDIFEKVGDMSRNHLVSQSRVGEAKETGLGDDDVSLIDGSLQHDIEIGRQGTMKAFLQPKKEKRKPTTTAKRPEKNHTTEAKAKQKLRKQSVILFEEVDVLFEEDKQFWATTMELILNSRRPVVMTCTDESLLPLDELAVFGIIRFMQPPVELAAEYLSLLAASEGHLLSREAVTALYQVKGKDLRASITELQFFCQMAIGDTKGGLEWMSNQPHARKTESIAQERVVSEGTYQKGMGWFGQQNGSNAREQEVDREIDALIAIRSGWGIDLACNDDFLPAEISHHSPSADHIAIWKDLEAFDLVLDALSAADTLQCPGFRRSLALPLDVSTPEMFEKDRMNYTEGSTLLQTDPLCDYSGVSDSIAAALRVFGRRTLFSTIQSSSLRPLDEQYITDALPKIIEAQNCPKPTTSKAFSTAFTPLSRPSRGSQASKGPFRSTFESPTSTIVTDIAPYVRSIVSYDLRLEEQRKQLELESQTGRGGKRARRTRASRAALEGGSKANTRRERWFPPNTDFVAVLKTGGKGWQEVALRIGAAEGPEKGGLDEAEGGAERRGSVSSIGSRGSGGRRR
ncbi:MAG: hypothetical protein LQ346_002070 [Caloplaca aetnensis]|nr:MAG: hypothetical protein LQ346_002070 [Caloplaca aetnensis]